MPWLKLLHIAALVIWCGSLLYLPALLSYTLQLRKDAGFAQGSPPMPRFFYNSVATPAALAAIFSGTLLFLFHGLMGGWLIFKLGAVVLMVVAHGCCGWLILRLEMGIYRGVKTASILALLLALAGILGVLGFVLAKPLDWS
ncbi:putative membrane protein [Vreelandella songnenensis]|uniref:Protoporphyrinogen IX oxidase n=1 Tax=Vreelandella songnenensis TaxID=1176243 RepID=A0A2T0UUM3_9GAMM|nr:CopD family protein [Halomonas songnenensis]PRY61632.1 putative membrane protein [Halomonas songnenensis]